MSRATSVANSSNDASGTDVLTVNDETGLFQTLQGHVDDLRALIQCGICIRPLYEPFTLACGHTFCYGCLSSWFVEARTNRKTCPDCRAPVKAQPAPAYLVRAMVQLFTSRAELLEKEETTDQHKAHQREEANRLEMDKKNEHPRDGGLFRGAFNRTRAPVPQPIVDLEDNILRCPRCAFELEDDECTQCGYRRDMGSMSDSDLSETDTGTEMTDDFEEEEDGFAEGGHDFDWHDWYEGIPIDALPEDLRHQLHDLTRNPHVLRQASFGMAHPHAHSEVDSHDVGYDDEEEEDEDEEEDDDTDMDGFIDDDEHHDYGSDSDRSTIVGGRGYVAEGLEAIYNDQPSSEYSVDQSGMYDSDAMPESDEDVFEEDDEEHDEDDSDEEEQPIRPAVSGDRRRIPTYQILSSSPARVNAGTARNVRSLPPGLHAAVHSGGLAHSRGIQHAGSSVMHAIDLDDDSDEGPVGPVRRARGNCWPATR